MKEYVIGIDEVGRGSLAGPVTVTALAIPRDFDFRMFDSDLGVYSPEIYTTLKNINSKPLLRDSKKLSPKQRLEWVNRIRQVPEIRFITKSVKPRVIDDINIANAANLAAYRAIKSLTKNYLLQVANCSIYLDGGLYIKSKKYQTQNFEDAETIIKGDELLPVVSLASIVAKVSRDKLMRRLSKIYPQYGLHVNKGYGTRDHIEAIKQHGLSEFHRLSFMKGILR